MVRSDENNPTAIARPVAQARGGKTMAMLPPVPNRRALGDINSNIMTAPHRDDPKKDQMLAKKQPPPIPPSRPITRRFAAQMSCIIPQHSASEGNMNLSNNNCRPCEPSSQDSEIIDVDDDMSVPSYVQHTQAMLEEIDLMDEEMEMEDAGEHHMVQDIDSCDKKNPLAVVEYIDDILAHYKKTEAGSRVPWNYMDHQADINGKMRAILIDWIIEVHYKFELMEETLYLTINLIDRFLARNQVVRKKLQLVGVTAMLIACKYEEVSVPVIDDFIVITDKAYTRKEVIQMERLMVNTLQFNLSLPTPYMFMRRFLKAATSSSSSSPNNKKLELLSLFMVELCLVEYEMLQYPASMLSAAAVFTAQCILSGGDCCCYKNWNMTCEWHCGYSRDQLLECARLMALLHQNAGSGKLTGVHRKYSTSKYGYAARSQPAIFLLETSTGF